MTKYVDEANLKSAILIQLLEYQGEEIDVDELVKDLSDAGFVKSYIEGLLSELFTKRQGVLLCGKPLGTSVMMPDDFQPPELVVAAHWRAWGKTSTNLAKILPTYFELVTAE